MRGYTGRTGSDSLLNRWPFGMAVAIAVNKTHKVHFIIKIIDFLVANQNTEYNCYSFLMLIQRISIDKILV